MADLRILLVDDEDLILQVLREFFRHRGDLCDIAANGTDALRLVEDRIYDIVLSDISMPGMDGLELIRRVKILQPHAVCILMSGLGTRRDILSALKIGVFDFVDKPMPDLATLTMVVDRAAESSRITRERDSLLENLKHQNSKLEYSLLRLHEAFGQLRRQEEALESDLSKAQRVQRKFLPASLPPVGGFEFFGYYGPCEQLGGDFFGTVPLPNGRIALYLVDVAGHGVTAAMVTVIVRELMRARLRAEGGAEVFQKPEEVLRFLNTALLEENFEPPIFASMIYAVLDPSTGQASVASAGHPAPIISSAANEQTAVIESGIVLGTKAASNYVSSNLQINPGDALLFYSDGLSEARSPEEKEFSLDRLHRVLAATPGASAGELAAAVERELLSHLNGTAPSDDVTFIAVSRSLVAPTEEITPRASGKDTLKILMPDKLRNARANTRGRAEAGWREKSAVIRLTGPMTWQLAPAFREMVLQGKERSTPPVHVDLVDCEAMDSTILGLLLQNAPDLVLHQPGPRVVGQMYEMGILPLFTVNHQPCPKIETPMDVGAATSQQACSDLILSAHEALMEASASNRKKFKEVVDTLRAGATGQKKPT